MPVPCLISGVIFMSYLLTKGVGNPFDYRKQHQLTMNTIIGFIYYQYILCQSLGFVNYFPWPSLYCFPEHYLCTWRYDGEDVKCFSTCESTFMLISAFSWHCIDWFDCIHPSPLFLNYILTWWEIECLVAPWFLLFRHRVSEYFSIFICFLNCVDCPWLVFCTHLATLLQFPRTFSNRWIIEVEREAGESKLERMKIWNPSLSVLDSVRNRGYFIAPIVWHWRDLHIVFSRLWMSLSDTLYKAWKIWQSYGYHFLWLIV